VQVDELRAEQNKASKAIGRAEGDEKQRLIDDVARVSAELKKVEPQLAEVEHTLATLLAATPNLPHESSPDGFTDDDAVEVRRHLEPTEFDFEPKDHEELGALLGMLDTERGARTSGSRFVYLLGDLVFVQFALMRHAMDILAGKGFVPAIPPVMVREEAMYGTGFLPADEAQLYTTTEDELYLVGTAEVPLAAFRMGEIVDEAELPLRYAGYSTCFRREAGTYGKDMGGMFRLHQFDKVEMFVFTTPEASWDEHEYLVSVEEEIVGNLEVPYRVVNVAAGDLGLLEHDRLPGPPAADAGAPGRWTGRGAAHAERHRDRDRPHVDRAAREPPAGRRLGRDAREAASVPARAGKSAAALGRLSISPRSEPRRPARATRHA